MLAIEPCIIVRDVKGVDTQQRPQALNTGKQKHCPAT